MGSCKRNRSRDQVGVSLAQDVWMIVLCRLMRASPDPLAVVTARECASSRVHVGLSASVRLDVVACVLGVSGHSHWGWGDRLSTPQVQRLLLHEPWLLRRKRDCTPALFLTLGVYIGNVAVYFGGGRIGTSPFLLTLTRSSPEEEGQALLLTMPASTFPPETYAVVFFVWGVNSHMHLQFLAPAELFFKQLNGCSF